MDGALVGVVCELFDLGAAVDLPVRLAGGGGLDETVLLRTARGHWVVKQQPGDEDWRLDAMTRSGRLERAARAAGVAVPRAVLPTAPDVALHGFWAHTGKSTRCRVSRWVDAAPVALPASVAVLRWVGRQLATIASLGLSGGADEDPSHPQHGMAEWAAWTSEAQRNAPDLHVVLAEAMPDVRVATERVAAGLARAPATVLCHRDVRPANVLAGQGARWLIDWDFAGPAVPWWEVVTAANEFSRNGGPDPAAVAGIVGGYLAAGGTAYATAANACVGLLHGLLGSLAYSSWLALGHRGADPQRQAAALHDVRRYRQNLGRTVASLPDWERALHRAVSDA